MTQRIFDVDNPQEIFDLFPDDVVRIKKSADGCWAQYKDTGEIVDDYVPNNSICGKTGRIRYESVGCL